MHDYCAFVGWGEVSDLSTPPETSRLPCPAVRIGQASATGRRARNEDFHGAMLPDGLQDRMGVLVCVADGIGSCADGRMAAEMTVRGLLNDYYGTPATWRGVRALYEVAASMNAWLHSEGGRRERGLGTTLVAALFRGRMLSLLSVGDSRCYRWHEGRLTCLTRDHVFAGYDGAPLTKAVGLDDRFTPDLDEHPLAAGERYLLLTDGAWRPLGEAGLAALAGGVSDPQATAEAVVAAALERDPADNTTAVVIDVDHLPPQGIGDVAREWAKLPVILPPKPGQSIDGFHVLQTLHRGPQGTVLLARDGTDGAEVVLKFPDPLADGHPGALEQFAREEWAGLRLRHANVVRVIGQPEGRRSAWYYVLERLDGATLRALLERDGPQPAADVAGWLRQAAAGLLALHRRGIVHRDVKPDNLVLTRTGRLVLIDLGLLHIDGLAAASAGRGMAGGTPGFMAPELYHGEQGDGSTDLFSLGVTGYALLTGKMPYGEPEPMVTPTFGPSVPLAQLRPDVPPALARAIERCLATDRRFRPQDGGELIAWLDQPALLAPPRFVPLVERDPLRFYQTGFWIFLAATVMLLLDRLR